MPGSNDYYSDASAPPAATPPEPESAEPKENEASDNQTAELPKAVLGGKDFKPGQEVVLKVVQVMEDSVLVKYASSEEPEPDQPAAPAEAPRPGASGGEMYG